MPRQRSTCPFPKESYPFPLSLRRTYPLAEGGCPFSEGRESLPRGTGVPLIPGTGPPTRGRRPLLRGRAVPFPMDGCYPFRVTCSPLPKHAYLLNERRVPISRGAGIDPVQEGPVTPFPTDVHPFSEGGAQFSTDGSHHPSDVYPRSVGLTGPIFRVDWDPSSAGRATPSQRNVGKEILFYPRMMTNRW